jgi:hypothetical protein
MAIISIPTSIGGVTIPGTTTKGPLGALFDSKYRLGSLQYPRDLGSATKGHVVKFSINEIEPTGYEEGREYTLPSITNPTDIWNSVTKLVGGETKINQTLKPKKKRVASTISLYMPDTVNFQYNSGYSNLSLMDVAKDTAGAVSNLPLVSDVNYSPNGWASHADGAPVQTTLTMNFKEIELVDRKKIESGY